MDDVTGKLQGAAARLRQTSGRIAENALIQAVAVQQIADVAADSAHELAVALTDVREAAKQAREAEHRVTATGTEIDALVRAVETLAGAARSGSSSMGEFLAALGRIDEIVDFVREVSERTNLLSLNAAIEAARAGDHGRGFAVVAAEIRKLADSTRSATAEMEKLLGAVRSGGEKTAQLAEASDASVREGEAAAASARDALGAIASAVGSTASAFDAVERSIEAEASRSEEFGTNAAQLLRTTRSHYADAVESTLAVNAIDFHVIEMQAGARAVAIAPAKIACALAATSVAGRGTEELTRRLVAAMPELAFGALQAQGGEVEALQAVGRGDAALAVVSAAIVGNVVPAIQLIEAPYLVEDGAHAHALLHGPYGTQTLASLAPFGLVGLGFMESGFKHVTNSIRPIRTPADVERLRLRVIEAPVHVAIADAWQAMVRPVPLHLLNDALRRREVDGQAGNSLPMCIATKIYETQRYLTLTAHSFSAQLIVANAAWFEAIGPEPRARVEAVVAETMAWQMEDLARAERAAFGELEKRLEITRLTDAEHRAFVAATNAAYPVIERLVGAESIAQIRRAAEQARPGRSTARAS